MSSRLPKTPEALLGWDWAQFEPLVRELLARPLDAGSAADWLQDWSDVQAALVELYNRLYLATAINTADAAATQAYTAYIEEIFPQSMEADQALRQKLLDSGVEPPGFEVALRNMRAETALYRAENLALLAEEQKLSNEFDKITGAQTVEWDGREVTVTQLRAALQEHDRERREQAWRLKIGRQQADRASLDELWVRCIQVRLKLAANAGQPDYRAYRWQQLLRFDYTPEDCLHFQEAIEAEVVPAAQRACERRRQRLGLSSLRPWDLDVDPLGRPPLRPYRSDGELKEKAAAIFQHVDPQLGAYFRQMVAENLLDLDNRKNKAPGAFCTDLPVTRRPYIFMNGVGLHEDAQTLLHESGHAFHAFESNAITLMMLQQAPMEFAEVSSIGMELLAGPYLEERYGGFYSASDAARARAEHLESALLFWPYMAVVDAFQHWVYAHPAEACDPAQCDAAWSRLYRRFLPWEDWSGLEELLATGWQRKLHIFQVPFYYVEYGLAQLGAAQVWRNALRDPADAVARYRQALALGGSVALPQLYEAAGARLAFDRETLGEAVRLMEEKMIALAA